jgi:hypothetical protein
MTALLDLQHAVKLATLRCALLPLKEVPCRVQL